MSTVFLGLMSGTSLDGVDAVLVDFAADAGVSSALPLRVLAHEHRPFDPELRAELLALNGASADELHRAALAGNALVGVYAQAVHAVLATAATAPGAVTAIGCHGQTVRHRPGEFDGIGYTLQLGAPALLAELTDIDVVCDFRSRDIAAGGQGAPLVPAFHRAAFAVPGRAAAVLNLGGIANLTAIDRDGATLGFDCGPANALLDGWIHARRNDAYDADGAWAASGRVDERLLQALRADPYFAAPPPKSTGRDRFHAGWLAAALEAAGADGRVADADVQATLAELTASTCADAVRAHAPGAPELVVCGGGARNVDLMARLGRRLAPRPVVASDDRGLPADQVEAVAFAWLARAFVRREPAALPSVTGARGARVLGALYPAR